MIFSGIKYYPKDIKKLFLTSFNNGLLFFLPILALYYEDVVFSLTKVALVLSVGLITLVVMEVPSGTIADLFGRKKTLILSKIIILISLVVLFIGGSFEMILAHSILRGIGRSLYSGTDSAMIYDILYEQKKSNLFKKIFGTYFSFWALGAAVGSVIGGHLADISFRLPVALTAIPIIIGTILISRVKEPEYHKATHKNMFKQAKDSLKTVFSNKQLIFLMLGILVIYFSSESLHSINALFFEFKNIPIFLIGYASALVFGLSSLGHYFGHDISEKFGNKKILILAGIASAFAVFISTLVPYIGAMIIYTISSFFFGIRNTVQNYLINKEIDSSQRATIVSINNLLRFLGVAIALPLIGLVGKNYNLNVAFQAGAIGIFIGALIFLFLKEVK